MTAILRENVIWYSGKLVTRSSHENNGLCASEYSPLMRIMLRIFRNVPCQRIHDVYRIRKHEMIRNANKPYERTVL